MIVLAVVRHVPKVGTQRIQEIPSFLPKPAVPGNVTRILIGHRFCNPLGRIDLDAPVSDILIKELHTVNNRNWRLTTG